METVKEKAILKEEIGEDDIARIVAKWTGIPVTQMLEGEIANWYRCRSACRTA